MAQDSNPRRELYDMLKADGYYNGNYSEFTANIDKPQARRELFDMLSADGYYNGDWEDFTSKLTVPKKVTPIKKNEPSLIEKGISKVKSFFAPEEEQTQTQKPQQKVTPKAENIQQEPVIFPLEERAYEPSWKKAYDNAGSKDVNAEWMRANAEQQRYTNPSEADANKPLIFPREEKSILDNEGMLYGGYDKVNEEAANAEVSRKRRGEIYDKGNFNKFWSDSVAPIFAEEKKAGEEAAKNASHHTYTGVQMPGSAAGNAMLDAVAYEKYTDPEKIISQTLDKVNNSNEFTDYVFGRMGINTSAKSTGTQAPLSEEEKAWFEKLVSEESADVMNKIREKMISRYKDLNLPQNHIEYLVGKVLNENFIQSITNAMIQRAAGSSGLREQLRQMAYQEYGKEQGNWGLRMVGGALPFAVDMISGGFAIPGMAGKMALKGGMKAATKKIVNEATKRATERGLTKAAATEAAEAAAQRYIATQAPMLDLALKSAAGMANFATYNVQSTGIKQFGEGKFDGNELLKEAVRGAMLGGALGAVGGSIQKGTMFSSTATKIGADVAGLGAEIGIFAMSDGMRRAIDEGVSIKDVDWADVIGESAGMVVGMKVAGGHLTPKTIRDRYGKSADYDLKFDKRNLDELEDAGYDLSSIFNGDLGKIVPFKTKDVPFKTKEIAVATDEKGNKQEVGTTVNIDADNYNAIMRNPNIGSETKRKLYYLVSGQVATPEPLFSAEMRVNEDGSAEIETFNATGNRIGIKDYNSKEEAEEAYNKTQDEARINTINAQLALSRKLKIDAEVNEVAIGRTLQETGIDVNEVLNKPYQERTPEEEQALDVYIEELRNAHWEELHIKPKRVTENRDLGPDTESIPAEEDTAIQIGNGETPETEAEGTHRINTYAEGRMLQGSDRRIAGTALNTASEALNAVPNGDLYKQGIDNYVEQGATPEQISEFIDSAVPAEYAEVAKTYYDAIRETQGVLDTAKIGAMENANAYRESLLPYAVEGENGQNTITTGIFNGEQVYILSDNGSTAIISQNGEQKQVKSDQIESVQTMSLDDMVSEYEESESEKALAEADFAMKHNPRTEQPYEGLVIMKDGQALRVMAVTPNGEVQVTPVKYDKNGELVPTDGTIQTLTGEEALALQDQYYDNLDNGVGTGEEQQNVEEESNDNDVVENENIDDDDDKKGPPPPPGAAPAPNLKKEEKPNVVVFPRTKAGDIDTKKIREGGDANVMAEAYLSEYGAEVANEIAQDYLKKAIQAQEKEKSLEAKYGSRKKDVEFWREVTGVLNENTATEQPVEEEPVATNIPTLQAGEAATEKWNNAEKLIGNEGVYTMDDGTDITGHYVLVEEGNSTPSHDPHTFKSSEGYPVDEQGRNVNSRDYQNSKNAQSSVIQMGSDYDGRALKDVPVVSIDGIVWSGNNRTMSGMLAAENNRDAKYIESLKKRAAQYGFTEEQIDGMQHPRVVFVPNEGQGLDYTSQTFNRFNAPTQKEENTTEKGVKMGKVLEEKTFNLLSNEVSNFGSLANVYKSQNASGEIIKIMQDSPEIVEVNQQTLPRYIGADGLLTEDGQNLLESALVGYIFKDNADILSVISQLPKRIVNQLADAMPELVANAKMGDFALTGELTEALKALYQQQQSGMSFEDFMKQYDMFNDTGAELYGETTYLFAKALTEGKNALRNVLNQYNERANDVATNQLGLFGNDTRESILKDVLANNGVEIENVAKNNENNLKDSEIISNFAKENNNGKQNDKALHEGGTLSGNAESESAPGETNGSDEENAGKASELGEDSQADRRGLHGSRTDKSEQEELIRKRAKENGTWFSSSEISNIVGENLPGGKEAKVYVSKDGHSVIKLVDYTRYSDTPSDFQRDRIDLYNDIFPDTAYVLLGYTEDGDGKLRFVLKQPFIEGPLLEDYWLKSGGKLKYSDLYPMLDKWLLDNYGLKKYGLDAYENDKVRVQDLHLKNVRVDEEGNFHVIDAIPSLKAEEKAAEVLKPRTDLATDEAFKANHSEDEQSNLVYREGEGFDDYLKRNKLREGGNDSYLYVQQKYADKWNELNGILNGLSRDNAEEKGKNVAGIVDTLSEANSILQQLKEIPVDAVLPFLDGVSHGINKNHIDANRGKYKDRILAGENRDGSITFYGDDGIKVSELLGLNHDEVSDGDGNLTIKEEDVSETMKNLIGQGQKIGLVDSGIKDLARKKKNQEKTDILGLVNSISKQEEEKEKNRDKLFEAYENEQSTIDTEGGLRKDEVSERSLSPHWRGTLHALGRNIGKRVVVLSGEDIEARGYDSEGTNGFTIGNTIYLNESVARDEKALLSFVTGHEITHILKKESPELWQSYVDAVKVVMGDKFAEEFARKKNLYDGFYDKYNATHKDNPLQKLTDGQIEEEVCCDFAGNNILNDEESAKRIIEQAENAGADPVSLTQKILDYIKQFIEKLKAAFMRGADVSAQIETMEHAKKIWQGMYDVATAKKNQRFATTQSEKAESYFDGQKKFSLVTDPMKIIDLEKEPKVKVYRAAQLRDGKLYPPMAGKIEGKWQNPIELGIWEQSDEHPELVDSKGKFKLDKGNGSSPMPVAYNPYIHTSRSPLNDQFASAWDRPELVTIEVEVPESELSSGYKAEKAKDAVGEIDWKSGSVSKQLAKTGDPRKVILSRYDKPIRIVPDAEVAERIAEKLEGTGIEIPFNTVTPSLRAELEKRGVAIGAPEKGNAGDVSMGAYEDWKAQKGETRFSVTPSEDKAYIDAVESGDVDKANEMVKEAAAKAGYSIHAYHGTGRADRVGNVFRPERATSGPMAFFTDNKGIAENYAKSKRDTSIAYDTDYDSYETQFRTTHKGTGKDYSIYDVWGFLPFDERNKIRERAKHIRTDWEGDGDIIYDENTTNANGGFDWQIKENRGDILKALNDQWLASGNLFNDEDRYLKVLELAGVNEALEKLGFEMPRYMNPEYREEAVYDVYLKIQNPFDVESQVNEDFIEAFEDYALDHEDEYKRETANSDSWDKNNIDADEFAERMRNDLREGWSHAWTSIPDVMTAYLKSLGYDGIKDTGGKNGGETHTVWVPFSSEQVKSAEAVTRDGNGNVIPLSQRFNEGAEDIRFSITEPAPIFVSNAAKAVDGIKQDKATPEQWLAMITKNGGLKAGEDKWLGLSDWLKGQDKKTLTKEEVLDFIRKNQIEVEDVNYASGGIDVDDNPYMKMYNNEFNKLVNDYTEERYEVEEDIEWFDAEMFDKYGEGWINRLDELTEEERKRNEEITERYDRLISDSPQYLAFQDMVEKYGDDFNLAFDMSYNGDRLIPTEDPIWEDLSDAAKHFLVQGEQTIDSMRLTYTTEGLDNKREIALVVPTIESWNASDTVHFGDAGEGRAVAWVRFGDTVIPGKGKAEQEAFDNAQEEWDEFSGKMVDKYGPAYLNKLNVEDTQENARLRAKVDAARENLKKSNSNTRVLVIDEIQSKRHQEGREKGYKISEEKAVAEMNAFVEKMKKKYEMKPNDAFVDFLNEEELAELDRLNAQQNDASFNHSAVPDAPFEKNWYELAMKRMLRYAAENGYDKVAWTTGDQQAKRYDLSRHVDEIRVYDAYDGEHTVVGFKDGNRVFEKDASNGEKGLAELVGKDIARKAYANLHEGVTDNLVDNDYASFKGDDLVVGGIGMRGFYDDILPRFMNKYGKKWGVEVGKVELPLVEADGRVMHSIDVTPEMKESVMEGQPMFSLSDSENVKKAISEYKAGVLSVQDMVTNTLIDVAERNKENLDARIDAVKALSSNLRSATARQREYDKSTVDQIVRLAKFYMKAGMFDSPAVSEVAKLVGYINSAAGKENIEAQAEKVVDLMLDHQLKESGNLLSDILKTKGYRTNQSGVKVQGKLDVEGQRMIDTFNKMMHLSDNDYNAYVATIINDMGSEDAEVANNASLDYKVSILFDKYKDGVKELKSGAVLIKDTIKREKESWDERKKTLSGDELKRARKNHNEFIDSLETELRNNKASQIQAYNDLLGELSGKMSASKERAKDFRDAEKQRVENIQHLANSDMKGRGDSPEHEERVIGKMANVAQLVLDPLGTLDTFLRMLGNKHIKGEGYLHDHFVRGLVEASDNGFKNTKAALDEVTSKLNELTDGKIKSFDDVYKFEKDMPYIELTWKVGKNEKSHTLTPGQALYVYMANKQTDGKMKLRNMGISEEDVDAIKNALDPRLIEWADWVQGEFLPRKRREYNAVHEKIYGASMDEHEGYFPIRVDRNYVPSKNDIEDMKNVNQKISNITGGIRKRTINTFPLDILHSDAFSVLAEHIGEMEDWASYASIRKDLNTLLSYKRFENQIKNMNTRFGSGDDLWSRFVDLCSIGAGTYIPNGGKFDALNVNMTRGLQMSNIALRFHTAVKQLLSNSVYLTETNLVEYAKSLAHPVESWNWAIKNLPTFARRWQSRTAGDPILRDTNLDWAFTNERWIKEIQRLGMTPNAFLDAMSVAIGGKAKYEGAYKAYKAMGYDDKFAKNRALYDAALLVNRSQQSSENAFNAIMQRDNTAVARWFSMYRNASFGYQREAVQALTELRQMIANKDAIIENDIKKHIRQGLSEEEAEKASKKAFNQSWFRNLMSYVNYGFFTPFVWRLGQEWLALLLYGGLNELSKERRKKAVKEAAKTSLMTGNIEGLAFGGDIAEAIDARFTKGKKWSDVARQGGDISLLTGEISSLMNMLDSKPVEAAGRLTDMIVSIVAGVKPSTVTNIGVALYDALHDKDPEAASEFLLFLGRFSNAPRTSMDKAYLTQIFGNKNLNDMTEDDFKKAINRYTSYRRKYAAGGAFPAYNVVDEGKSAVVEEKYAKQLKETMKEMGIIKDAKFQYDKDGVLENYSESNEYKRNKQKYEELNAAAKRDIVGYAEKLEEFRNTEEGSRFLAFKKFKDGISRAKNKKWRTEKLLHDHFGGDAPEGMSENGNGLVKGEPEKANLEKLK